MSLDRDVEREWNDDNSTMSVFFEEVMDLFDEGKYENAIKVLSAKKIDPDWNKTEFALYFNGIISKCFLNLGDYETALNHFINILRFVEDSDIDLSIAKCYFKLEDIDRGIFYAERVLLQDHTDCEVLTLLGELYMKKNDEKTAMIHLKKAFSFNNADAASAIGWICITKNEYGEAIKYLEKAVEWNPENDEFWQLLGFAYNRNEVYDKSIECSKKAVELNDKNASAYVNLASSCHKIDRLEDVIIYCDKALNISENLGTAWAYKGLALSDMEDVEPALECFEKAIKLGISDVNILISKGICHEILKNDFGAMLCYDKVIQIESENILAWKLRADIYKRQDYLEGTILCYEQMLMINSEDKSLEELFETLVVKYDECKAKNQHEESEKTLDNIKMVYNILKKFNKTTCDNYMDIAQKINP